jgi:predicted PurR-regulated permease PerM
VLTIQLSILTIIKVIGILVALVFLFLISDVLGIIFIAMILAAALEPVIHWLQQKGLHRILATVFIYLGIFVMLFGVVFALVPPVTKQASDLANHFPYYYNKVIKNVVSFSGDQLSQETAKQLLPATSAADDQNNSITSTIFDVFGGLVGFILVWVIAFYFIVEEKGLKQFVSSLSPTKFQDYYLDLLDRIKLRTGAWFRGQLFTSVVVGLLYYAGLQALGVPYALLLAVLGGVFEVVPFLGPIVAAIPVVVLGFIKSPLIGILTILLYFVVQQLESSVITPRVFSERVRLNPLFSVIVILIGFKVGGLFGAILAVPVATAASVIISDIVNKKLPQEV